jgi:protein gp37
MSKTSIEWTQETWNPTVGCDRISPGCAHCYAKTLHDKRHRAVLDGAQLPAQYLQPFETLQLMPDRLDAPLRRKKPTTYFVNSVSDLFHEDVPETFILDVFSVMQRRPQHTFQILTKRADRMRTVVGWLARKFADVGEAFPLPNVWLGVSVENQHFADERIPQLLQTQAAVRFVSAEPLLEAINIRRWLSPARCISTGIPMRPVPEKDLPGLDWVIPGFESGANARPGQVVWIRSLVQQCAVAGVACFVKQLGAKPIDRNDAGFEGDTPTSWPMDTDVEDSPNGCREEYQGAPVRVRLTKKGGDPAEWPEDLRVREMPGGGT